MKALVKVSIPMMFGAVAAVKAAKAVGTLDDH